MATVYISKELIRSVVDSAGYAFDKANPEFIAPIWPAHLTADVVYDMAFGHLKEKLADVPQEFLARTKLVQINGVNGVDCYVKLELSDYMPIPVCEYKYYNAGTGTTASSDGGSSIYRLSNRDAVSLRLSAPVLQEYADDLRNFHEGTKTRKEAKRKFLNDLERTLQQFSTLSPALKAIPMLWDLLPEETRTKHKTVVAPIAKSPRKERAVEISDALNATLTAAKLNG